MRQQTSRQTHFGLGNIGTGITLKGAYHIFVNVKISYIFQRNSVTTHDERKVTVTAAYDGRKLNQGITTKRGFFNLQEPTQEYTSLLIAPDFRHR